MRPYEAYAQAERILDELLTELADPADERPEP